MATPRPWIFRQVGGQRKTLELRDYSAPFGRPRQSAVARKPITARKTEKYYNGRNKPTRLIAGIRYEPIELRGRFMDRALGTNGAKAKAREVDDFVADLQPVTIHWGDIINAVGFIDDFDPGFESEGEIEWKMKISIDVDTASIHATEPVYAIATSSSQTVMDLDDAATKIGNIQLDYDFLSFKQDFVDAIDDQVSNLNTYLNAFRESAAAIDTLESATSAELRRFRASVNSLMTSIRTLANTLESAQDDAAVEWQANDPLVVWASYQADLLALANRAGASAAELERQAELADRGTATTQTIVQAGETWESISQRVYGTAAKAQLLRDANGARYGELPKAGIINVPLDL